MGGDGPTARGLPVSLKVKNTFIDVNSNFVEDDIDIDEAAFPHTSLRKRQVSEPVPCIQRQISDSPFHRGGADGRSPVPGPGRLPAGGLLEEEDPEFDLNGDDADELEEHEEPEIEKDPQWVLGRQESELAWQPSGGMRRQETEQCWPSWVPASGRSPNVVESAAGGQEPMMVRTEPGEGGMQGAGGWESQQPDVATDEALAAMAAQTDLGSWLAMAGPLAVQCSQEGGEGTQLLAAQEVLNGCTLPPPEWDSTSTVMMRNLPNKYTQQMLLDELNQSGFQGTFDFMYLPIDPGTHANRGYAFINFVDPKFAWMLKMTYEGRKMSRFNSDKVVYVAPAALQGFEANYAHYSTARVNRGDPAARPLFLCKSQTRLPLKAEGGRRRGGRRSSGSLIDQAAKHQQQSVMASVANNQLAGAAGPWGATTKQGGDATGAPKRAEPGATPKFCPYCGGRCQSQFRFCQFCGASLNIF